MALTAVSCVAGSGDAGNDGRRRQRRRRQRDEGGRDKGRRDQCMMMTGAVESGAMKACAITVTITAGASKALGRRDEARMDGPGNCRLRIL